VLYGNDNVIHKTRPTVIGNNNTINSHDATVTGSHNTVNGNRAIVRGDNNHVTGNLTTVCGEYNTIRGRNAAVEGGRNHVTGDCAMVLGNRNTVTGEYASARGSNNTVTGLNATSATNGAGRNNIVNGVPIEQQQQRPTEMEHFPAMQGIQDPRPPLSTLQATFQPYLPVPLQQLHLSIPQQQQQQQQLPPKQPIKLTLRGHDEECTDNENGDTCLCCLNNKAIVASACCGKLTACLACTREMYEYTMVGETKCLNCQGFVEHMIRIS
jgi:hypothetical protein